MLAGGGDGPADWEDQTESAGPGEWRARPRYPITVPRDRVERILLGAQEDGCAVLITYAGGSEPGSLRAIHPALLFTFSRDVRSWPRYVLAFCHLRQAPRTFRIDRIREIA